MFCSKQAYVHWVNLMEKKIISKFQRLEILNQMVARENIHFFILICLLSISIKLKISSSKHMSCVYL
jgi:hypothetical protein